MHIPKQFNQTNEGHLKALISDYPFATVIGHGDGGLEAHHIPLYLASVEGRDVLRGHIAKANPWWRDLKDGANVLVVFNGPNCYISPSHYPTKKATAKAVPTWNYVVVHVQGAIRTIHDKHWNLTMIDHLTRQHEVKQALPWSIEDAPATYIDKMLAAIVGLEIEVLSIKGQWKLSQNQPSVNQQGVVAGLAQDSSAAAQKIADLVHRFSIDTWHT